jgi:tetratricopeptide (TPR) repeat protein
VGFTHWKGNGHIYRASLALDAFLCRSPADGVTVVAGDESGVVHFLRLEMDAPVNSCQVEDPYLGRTRRRRDAGTGRNFDDGQLCWHDIASSSEKSENPLSLLSEGLSLVQQGREEEAMSCWEKAVKLRPDAASMIWENGGKALEKQGLSLVQQGREEEAMSCWEKAVKLRPDAASMIWENGGKALEKQGEALWEAENYQGAVRCFQQAVQLQPKNAAYWTWLAASQGRSGDAEAALSSYETALNLEPDAAYFWSNRGVCFSCLGSL